MPGGFMKHGTYSMHAGRVKLPFQLRLCSTPEHTKLPCALTSADVCNSGMPSRYSSSPLKIFQYCPMIDQAHNIPNTTTAAVISNIVIHCHCFGCVPMCNATWIVSARSALLTIPIPKAMVSADRNQATSWYAVLIAIAEKEPSPITTQSKFFACWGMKGK